MGKIYEKIIKDRLELWSESNHIIQECQNGLRKGRSAQDNVYSFVAKVKNNAIVGHTGTFLDIKGA